MDINGLDRNYNTAITDVICFSVNYNMSRNNGPQETRSGHGWTFADIELNDTTW